MKANAEDAQGEIEGGKEVMENSLKPTWLLEAYLETLLDPQILSGFTLQRLQKAGTLRA